jgi:hypothetical protein
MVKVPAQRDGREKLPGKNERLETDRHWLRSETPASLNVAISVSTLTAA